MSKDNLYKFMFEHLEEFRNGVDTDYLNSNHIGYKSKEIRKELNKLCEVRRPDTEKRTKKYYLREEGAEFLSEFYSFCERQKLIAARAKTHKHPADLRNLI